MKVRKTIKYFIYLDHSFVSREVFFFWGGEEGLLGDFLRTRLTTLHTPISKATQVERHLAWTYFYMIVSHGLKPRFSQGD